MASPTTDQLFGVIRDNAKFNAQVGTGLSSVDDRLEKLEAVAVASDGKLGRLVELGEARQKREEAEHVSRIAREKASEEALARRTAAEIAESERRGAWFRTSVGDRLLIPAASAAIALVVGFLGARLGMPAQPTQTITVEAPRPAAPAPDPAPTPEPTPEPVVVPSALIRPADDLLDYPEPR